MPSSNECMNSSHSRTTEWARTSTSCSLLEHGTHIQRYSVRIRMTCTAEQQCLPKSTASSRFRCVCISAHRTQNYGNTNVRLLYMVKLRLPGTNYLTCMGNISPALHHVILYMDVSYSVYSIRVSLSVPPLDHCRALYTRFQLRRP